MKLPMKIRLPSKTSQSTYSILKGDLVHNRLVPIDVIVIILLLQYRFVARQCNCRRPPKSNVNVLRLLLK